MIFVLMCFNSGMVRICEFENLDNLEILDIDISIFSMVILFYNKNDTSKHKKVDHLWSKMNEFCDYAVYR